MQSFEAGKLSGYIMSMIEALEWGLFRCIIVCVYSDYSGLLSPTVGEHRHES